MKKLSILAVVGLLVASTAAAQTHPNLERGFKPGKAYQVGEIDSVNLFNGNLTLQIPIGREYKVGGRVGYQLKLFYNSGVWDYAVRTEGVGDDSETYTQAWPSPLSNAGLGWRLSFGELIPDSDWTPTDEDPEPQQVADIVNTTPSSMYIDGSGARHSFYPTLHQDEDGGVNDGVSYTRDGTYLRKKNFDGYALIEYPNGVTHRFEPSPDGDNRWRLTEIFDAYSNQVTVTYCLGDNPPDTCNPSLGQHWLIEDSQGRRHVVSFADSLFDAPYGPKRVSTVRFDLDGEDRLFSFDYRPEGPTSSVLRSSKHEDTLLPDPISVDLLATITQPDGSAYRMAEYFTSNVVDGTTLPGLSGVLQEIVLPTGAVYHWTYSTYSYPSSPNSCAMSDPFLTEGPHILGSSLAVAKKSVQTLPGQTPSEWDYVEVGDNARRVSAPDGAMTEHYFSLSEFSAGTFDGWDYGLPFDPTQTITVDGRDLYMSARESVPTGDDQVRYVRYEHDKLVESANPQGYGPQCGQWFDTNRRVAETVTRFQEGGPSVYHQQHVLRTDFDGFGHYRSETRVGFGVVDGDSSQDPVTDNSQFTFSSSDPQGPCAGDYEIGDDPDDPDNLNQQIGGYSCTNDRLDAMEWVLNMKTESTRESGGATIKKEYAYNNDFLLERVRHLADTGATVVEGNRDPHDVLEVYAYDAFGNRSDEWYYGGDDEDHTVGVGPLAGLTLSEYTPAYHLRHEYEGGILARSWYDGAGFYLVDRDIDVASGLVEAERDSAEVETEYEHDALGRVTRVSGSTALGQPSSSATVNIDYSLPTAGVDQSGFDNPSIHVTYEDPMDSSLLAEEYFFYDGLGRMIEEQRLMPESEWTTRRSEYNEMGWVDRKSQWSTGDPTAWTEYTYDRFGRPLQVHMPDGSWFRNAYRGAREVWNERTISGQGYLTHTVKDHLGRARLVEEGVDQWLPLWVDPNDPGAPPIPVPPDENSPNEPVVSSTYDYHASGELSQVVVTDLLEPDDPPQTRQFTYDGRGFLLSEEIPEKLYENEGGGTPDDVVYNQYDARGNVRQLTDGGTVYTMTYDAAERLTATSADGDPVESRQYGSDNGISDWRQGKLTSVTAHNRFDSGQTDVPVTEAFTHSGRSGALSSKTTTVDGAIFDQHYTYTPLGAVERISYPVRRAGVDEAAVAMHHGWDRWVVTEYEAGYPVAMPGYVSGISYHATGMIENVEHANGLTDTWELDSSGMGRVGSISVMDPTDVSVWSSGIYQYDDAGNIVGIGNDAFIYDGLSRLTSATVHEHRYGASQGTRTYEYDGFGNRESVSKGSKAFAPKIEDSSNHLSGQLYDSRGNQLTWGDYNTDSGSYDYEYTYHPNNRMQTVSGEEIGDADAHEYVYNADGERVLSIKRETNGDETRRFTLRGPANKPLREFELEPTGEWKWTKDYIWGPTGLAVTVGRDAGTKHYHLDHLGTPRLISDGCSAELAWHDYWPFGEETLATKTLDTERIKFTGHERDLHSGAGTDDQDDLDYMHARYYSFHTARFLSVDPVKGEVGSSQSWNRYGYVRNNPVGTIDPNGEKIVVAASASDRKFRQKTLATLQALTRDQLGMRPNGTVIIRKLASGSNLSAGTKLVRQLNQKGPGAFTNTIVSAPGAGNGAAAVSFSASSNGSGSDSTVSFDPSSSPTIDVVDSQGNFTTQSNRPNQVGLAHELIHANHINQGSVNYTKTTVSVTDASGHTLTSTAANEEHRAVGVGGNAQPGDITENQIRREQNQPERAIY